MTDGVPDEKSLSDAATFAGQSKRQRPDVSLGDERTRGGGGVVAGLDTIIDDIEVVDLDARYKVEGTLGQGGMGAVILATDTRLDRKVAIKRILGESAGNKMAVQRFLTEAKAIAALNHPNIVQIYDYGRAKDGPFLIMEYVDGGSLLDRCRESAMPLDEAIDLACHLCDGLAKAHDLNIVHRDIKPANVLLTKDGNPKLTDFGLAKAQAGDHGQTMTGAVLGTPDFMPPEQRRDAGLVDHRSDLWSLAATVYQMVTGRSPKIIRFNDVPAALQDVLAKALEDSKDARYQSAREFRDALKTSVLASATVTSEIGEGQCPACGVKNDSSRRFCRGCGESLEAACLSCSKPMPMWEEICGSCGTKQSPLVGERRQAMAAQQAEAEGLLGDFQFDKAEAIANQLREEAHPRLRHLAGWAETFLKQIDASRTQHTKQAVEAIVEADKHEAAHDYLSAHAVLELIPDSLRADVLPGMRESAAAMLARMKKTQGEVRRLEARLKERLAAKQLDDLLPDVVTFLALQPDRKDVSKIHSQLLERRSRQAAARDEALAAARKSLTEHDYEKALASLMNIAATAVTPEVVALREEAEALVRKVQAFAKRIKDALSAKRLDGLLPTVDEYLTLKPGDTDVAELRQSLLEREKKLTSEIALRFEQAAQLEGIAQFAKAAQLLQAIPKSRRSAELQACLNRSAQLAVLQDAVINLLGNAKAGTYGEAVEGCRSYRERLAEAKLADPLFASLFAKAEAANAEEQQTRKMLFMTGAVAAGIIAVIVSACAGLWIRSAMKASVVATAIRNSRWDDALAIEPGNPTALAGRAQQKLRSSPPDVEGAFADLDRSESGSEPPATVKSLRAEAHAIRAAHRARNGEVDRAADDLQAAVREGAAEGFVAPAREAIAKAWLSRGGRAAAKGDGPAIRDAANAAMKAGADRTALLALWQEYAKGRVAALDSKGLELACVEAGLNGPQAEWWIHFGMTAAAPPHENAAEVTRAADAALAAGADRSAVIGLWREYVKGRIAKFDGKGVELACAELKKAGLKGDDAVEWWIRFGMMAAEPPHENASEVARAVNAALAAGADRSTVIRLWREYVKGRIAKLDGKGVELACAKIKKAGLNGDDEAEWWIQYGTTAAEPAHENAAEILRAADAALAAGASAADVAPMKANALVFNALAAHKKGDNKAAISILFEASLLDKVLVQTTLGNPAHAALRTAVVADYRTKFVEAIEGKDWGRALEISATAETTDKSAEEWVAAAVAALPQDARASLPQDVLASLPSNAIPGLLPIRNSIGIELKLLPAGTFTMCGPGITNDEPHKVQLTKPFFIGVHEVTNAQWKRVMKSMPSNWTDDRQPVEQVSWQDAVEFCTKLSLQPEEQLAGRVYRLPTEAEWEYACRAGTETLYSFGDDQSQLVEYAWYATNSGNQSHHVGLKKPNPWGIFDMHGNVWEWCSDWHGEHGRAAVTDPQGPAEASPRHGRVGRGGSWLDIGDKCYSGYRRVQNMASVTSLSYDPFYGFNPSSRSRAMGFRVALSLSVAQPEAAAPAARTGDSNPSHFVVDMKPVDFKAGTEQGHYSLDGRIPVDKYGKVDHGPIRLNGNPGPKSFCIISPSGSFSQLTFEVPPESLGFQTTVAMADTSLGQRSPVTFRVLDDHDDVLWSSKPLRGAGATDSCQISVRGKKLITLKVECPGDWFNAHSIWVNPQFTTTAPARPVADQQSR